MSVYQTVAFAARNLTVSVQSLSTDIVAVSLITSKSEFTNCWLRNIMQRFANKDILFINLATSTSFCPEFFCASMRAMRSYGTVIELMQFTHYTVSMHSFQQIRIEYSNRLWYKLTYTFPYTVMCMFCFGLVLVPVSISLVPILPLVSFHGY